MIRKDASQEDEIIKDAVLEKATRENMSICADVLTVCEAFARLLR